MTEIWDRLREATDNDEGLVTILQQLFTLDPEPRANFAALAEHPYLQQAIPTPVPGSDPENAAHSAGASSAVVDAHVSPSSSPSLAASAAVKDAAALWVPDLRSLATDMKPSTVSDTDPTAGMQPIPGIPFLIWDPTSVAVCEVSSGVVYR